MKLLASLGRWFLLVLRPFQMFFTYRRTFWFLWRGKGCRALYNFLFIKCFTIAGGEGTANWLGDILRPVYKFFPKLKLLLYRRPFALEVEISNKCNKKCILCEHTYWSEPGKDLRYEDFVRIVDQFPKLKWMNLTGMGDAFLNRSYLDMVEYVKQRNVVVDLVDSFDFIDQERARRIIDLGVDGIWTSFDACTPETYHFLKEGCDFDRSVANLKRLLRMKAEAGSPIPEICFRYVINTRNLHEMAGFVELVGSLGGRKALGDGSRIEFAGLLAFPEIAEFFVEEVPSRVLAEVEAAARRCDVNVSFAHPKHRSKLIPAHYCGAWSEPYIILGGYVMPCCAVLMSNRRDFLREHTFGNLLETPFQEIWNSPRYRQARRLICDPKGQVPILCAGCRAFNTLTREETYGISPSV